MALISTLIIAFIMILLSIHILDMIIIENKITGNFSKKLISFELAESGLALAKMELIQENVSKKIQGLNYSIVQNPKNKTQWLITSTAKYHGAYTQLLNSIEFENQDKKIKNLFWKNLH